MRTSRNHLLLGVVLCVTFMSQTGAIGAAEARGKPAARLQWSAVDGVTLVSAHGKIMLDRNASAAGPVLRFPDMKFEQKLSSPRMQQPRDDELVLHYETTGPEHLPIKVVRHITMNQRPGEVELVEEFSLIPAKEINTDVEIVRPFSLQVEARQAQAVLPLYNGWARPMPLESKPLRAQWELGNMLRDGPAQQLALPVVQVGSEKHWIAAVCADPYFSSLYELSADATQIGGAIRYRYAASQVPLRPGQTESRRFGIWLATAKEGEPFGRSMDAFFRLMLPDVPPGPKWLHQIAMVGYDYLSDSGEGWERDVRELSRLLTPAERRRVALCFHGWYEDLNRYSYDDAKKEMKTEWVAMARTRKVRQTQDLMRRRLKFARDEGFRVLLYFADGVLQDSGLPSYRADWDFVDLQGKKVTGWTGPDTWKATFARNPAHPQVAQWYQDYLAALLRAYGPVVDGFVWDESNYIRTGAISRAPQPAYSDRAMMLLVKRLARMVEEADREKVFLSSENIGVSGKNVPGYGIVAHGIYQDSWCEPEGWPYGLFPAWRNVLWSCNWWPFGRFKQTEWGVEHFGVPVAISNGWQDDRGPAEWTPQEREKIMGLFRQRLQQKEPVRYLTVDPATLLKNAPK